jgi:hypothetical protein
MSARRETLRPRMTIDIAILNDSVLRLAIAAGDVANYCDHIEHNEVAHIEVIRAAGAELRLLCLELSDAARRDAFELYATRLDEIETRNVLCHDASPCGSEAVRSAGTWRDLQIAQAAHDKAYHPDVVGLAKADQLRHYSLHLAKLAGVTAGVVRGEVDHEDWLRRRVPDLLLFGLKLSTVTGQKLPQQDLPRDVVAYRGGASRSAAFAH